MKYLKYVSALLVILVIFSFKVDTTVDVVGVYGCSCTPIVIELTIHSDSSFQYKDHSNTDKPIDVKGTWSLKKGHLVLTGSDESVKFHNNWKLDDTCNAIKARKGMTFYRLIKEDVSKK